MTPEVREIYIAMLAANNGTRLNAARDIANQIQIRWYGCHPNKGNFPRAIRQEMEEFIETVSYLQEQPNQEQPPINIMSDVTLKFNSFSQGRDAV